MMIEWEKNFDRKMDKDNPDDMNWVFEKAKERADEYGIKGVTYKLTMGVTKNIIPAVASTNAIVSAACVNETIKILTGCAKSVDNYMQYGGQSNVSCNDLAMERKQGCFVCSREVVKISV